MILLHKFMGSSTHEKRSRRVPLLRSLFRLRMKDPIRDLIVCASHRLPDFPEAADEEIYSSSSADALSKSASTSAVGFSVMSVTATAAIRLAKVPGMIS